MYGYCFIEMFFGFCIIKISSFFWFLENLKQIFFIFYTWRLSTNSMRFTQFNGYKKPFFLLLRDLLHHNYWKQFYAKISCLPSLTSQKRMELSSYFAITWIVIRYICQMEPNRIFVRQIVCPWSCATCCLTKECCCQNGQN